MSVEPCSWTTTTAYELRPYTFHCGKWPGGGGGGLRDRSLRATLFPGNESPFIGSEEVAETQTRAWDTAAFVNEKGQDSSKTVFVEEKGVLQKGQRSLNPKGA